MVLSMFLKTLNHLDSFISFSSPRARLNTQMSIFPPSGALFPQSDSRNVVDSWQASGFAEALMFTSSMMPFYHRRSPSAFVEHCRYKIRLPCLRQKHPSASTLRVRSRQVMPRP